LAPINWQRRLSNVKFTLFGFWGLAGVVCVARLFYAVQRQPRARVIFPPVLTEPTPEPVIEDKGGADAAD